MRPDTQISPTPFPYKDPMNLNLTIRDTTPSRVEHTLATLFPYLYITEPFAVSTGDNAWSLRIKTAVDTYIDLTDENGHLPLYASDHASLRARRLMSLSITFST